ncbi:MAG: DUF523 and DUF1722 domain-containing protein [Gammaproteobacteria bacterium]|nr:DUF523 and DUF1722 domain-containing protein [Gammaproteobacteria bacterium]
MSSIDDVNKSKMNENFSEINKNKLSLPLLGVSACLLGKEVRFDGGHKKNSFILSSLSSYINFESVCPEMEAGFGMPRPAMQLRQRGEEVRLVFSKNPENDVTDQLINYSSSKVNKLEHLDGFIFKKDSPSCGAFRVPLVIHEEGFKNRQGVGLFAKTFIDQYPLIPVEDEGRLNDAAICENFFERVYAYRRWKKISNANENVKGLIDFHARHKLMLMARGSHFYQELGRLVAGTTTKDLFQKREKYILRFMQIMKITTHRGRQVNVLQHIMGYLKQAISSEDKQELLSVFEAYRQRQLPLITPVTLLRHHLRVHPQNYISEQHYLEPFPEQLALRSAL